MATSLGGRFVPAGAGIALVMGGDLRGAAFALRLARAGWNVELVEPDPSTAARITDTLGRAGPAEPGRLDVRMAPTLAEAAGLVVLAEALPPLPDDCMPEVLVLGLDTEVCVPGMVPVVLSGAPLTAGLAEVVTGCADAAREERAQRLLETLGLAVLRVADGPLGTPGQLLWGRMRQLCGRLVLVGALPWEIDEALVARGWAEGPFEAEDRVGLDQARRWRRRVGLVCPVADRMLAEGRLGRAAGVGWYRYPGGGGAVIDPLIEDLIAEEAHFAGLARAPLDGAEAADLLLAAMGMVAAEALACGAVAGRRALGLLALHGLGMPEGSLVAQARPACAGRLEMLGLRVN